jgi:hypothetical protein
MSFMREAFRKVCTSAKSAESWYVCLMRSTQQYGGPEEGGWWVTNTELLEYQEFPSEVAARAASDEVSKFAIELTKDAQRSHDRGCAESVEWLEARGLDADFLPEPDGPERFSTRVCQELPVNRYGPTHYE